MMIFMLWIETICMVWAAPWAIRRSRTHTVTNADTTGLCNSFRPIMKFHVCEEATVICTRKDGDRSEILIATGRVVWVYNVLYKPSQMRSYIQRSGIRE